MIKIRDLAFEYFDRDEEGNLTDMVNAIKEINLDVKKGDFIAIAGKNGSGKSTLARILNRLLVPIEGTVVIAGMDAMDEDNTLPIRKKVGMVFQNPDDQLFGSLVSEDVAFGAENIGVPQAELWQRVMDAVRAAGLEMHMADRRINELSGGEKQKVAMAGVLAMKPECIVLDEATSMLDPASRWEILQTMKNLNEKTGITIIMITHMMEELLLADHIYIMHQGKMVMHGRREAIFHDEERLRSYGLECPMVVRLARRMYERKLIRTADIFSVRDLIERIHREHPRAFLVDTVMPEPENIRTRTDPVNAVLFDGVSYAYGKDEVLHDISFSVSKGEYVAIMGHTGSGKSTLLQMVPGLLVPQRGSIYVDGIDVNDRSTDKRRLRCKIGYVFQYPEQQLFAKNVYEDVVFGPRNVGVSEVEAEKRAYESIELVGLPQDIYDIPISKLSGGQKRRVALAGVLAMKPEYLILDEPIAGLDPEGKSEMLQIIDILHREAGITIIMVSHDVESVAQYADRVIVLEQGNLVCNGRTAEVFYSLRDQRDNLPVVMQVLVGLRERGLPVACLPEYVALRSADARGDADLRHIGAQGADLRNTGSQMSIEWAVNAIEQALGVRYA
ncbi:MAG: energy-coupling factor transporter ATPase [Wujia sp.]